MAARKVTATKTTNPLHFEDLEPKRFEDLVRQLAYGFRAWRVLEPTGLLGDDEGIDILGIEAPPADESSETRSWRFQCKRYRRLGPKQIREVVHEVVPDQTNAPYGLVVAAACNLTAEAILAFHEEAKKVGVQEAHFWSKAKLEDLLFQAENDHLLFAYFNISLRTKRRSELERVRHVMAVKRKLVSAFQADTLAALAHEDLVVRDVNDEHYPSPAPGKGASRSWHGARALWTDHAHLVVQVRRWVGWNKPDGTWDIDDESSESHNIPELRDDAEHRKESHRLHRERVLLEKMIPESERISVTGAARLPYAAILEVDPIADPRVRAPHLICEYNRDAKGPYDGFMLVHHGSYAGYHQLDDTKQDPSLFEELRKTADLSEEAWKSWCEKSTAERHGSGKKA